jgi:hypothetical protein
MSGLPADALLLAGFALAHAAWSVSDLTADELLCPLALVEIDRARRLVRFEADTQVAAIAAMKKAATEFMRVDDGFASVREGLWRPTSGAEPVDVLMVEFWSRGMKEPAAALQPFRRASEGLPFVLLSPPALSVGGRIVAHDAAWPAIDVILEGVHSHSAVAPLWAEWQQG